MRKVVLICAAGMSTSLLVEKIKVAALDQDYDINIEAFPIAKHQDAVIGADIVLLGPQIRYELNKVKKSTDKPVEVIDMRAYGMMDGQKVVKQIKETLGD